MELPTFVMLKKFSMREKIYHLQSWQNYNFLTLLSNKENFIIAFPARAERKQWQNIQALLIGYFLSTCHYYFYYHITKSNRCSQKDMEKNFEQK